MKYWEDLTFTPAMSDEIAGLVQRLAREQGEFYPVGSAIYQDKAVAVAVQRERDMDAYLEYSHTLAMFNQLDKALSAWAEV